MNNYLRIFKLTLTKLLYVVLIFIVYLFGQEIVAYNKLYSYISVGNIIYSAFAAFVAYVFVSIFDFFLNSDYKGNFFIDNLNYKVIFVVVFLYYLIFYIIYFPGIITYDSYNQIAQALGWIPLENNNPIFHTFLMLLVTRPVYTISSNVFITIGIWNMFSILLFSLIITFVSSVILKFNVDKRVNIVIIVFLIFNPIYVIHSVTIWKDVWLSYFALLYIASLFSVLNMKCHNKYLILLVISTLGVLCFKGTGIIIIISSLPFIIYFHDHSNFKRIVVIVFTCVLVYFISLNVLETRFGILPHNNGDAFCSVWQIEGRIISDNYNNLDESDINFLNRHIDVINAKNNYTPYSANAIKGNYYRFMKTPISSFGGLFKIISKYKMSAINALSCMFSGYLYPRQDLSTLYCYNYYDVLNITAKDLGLKFDPDTNNYNKQFGFIHQKIRRVPVKILYYIKMLPIIGAWVCIGWYFLFYLYFFIFACSHRLIKVRKLLFIIFGIYLTCALSPLSGSIRYALPAIILFPLYVAMLMHCYHEQYDLKLYN